MNSLRILTEVSSKEELQFELKSKSTEDRVKASIVRDLLNLGWKVNFNNSKIEISPPPYYDKEIIRQSMCIKRNEIIRNNKMWIDGQIGNARENLACGVFCPSI